MYESLKKRFTDQFGTKPGFVFSAPGRTEIGGNHTDHQHGCVLAGAVNLDTVAAVARSERGAIRVLSEGYPLPVGAGGRPRRGGHDEGPHPRHCRAVRRAGPCARGL